MKKVKGITNRIVAMLMSGMLVVGAVPGTVLASENQADIGQTSEITAEVPEGTDAEEVSAEAYSQDAVIQEAEASEEEAAQYYTVILDANGGYFENEWDDALGETAERAEVIEKHIPVGGTVDVVPAFTETDQNGQLIQTRVFTGWSLERDGELVSQAEKEYIPLESCVLYAVWQAEDTIPGETEGQEVADEENTEQVDDVQNSEEVEDASDETLTAEEGAVEEDTAFEANTDPETENEQDNAPDQESVPADEDAENISEDSSDAAEVEEESQPELNESSEEEETVREDASKEIVERGTSGDNLTWTYDYNEQTLTIRGTGEMTDCEYLDLDGSEFGDNIISYAGYFRSYCKSVIIEDGVTTIMDCAFSGWGSLESVAIPNSIVTIGDYAFRNCTSLTSVTIPDSVTSIGDYAFDFCTSLTSVVIPNSVTSIGRGVFYDCRSLTSVTIPDSVTSISESAFSECSNLESVEIPDSVTSIGGYAFNGCSRLNSVTIPDSVTSIGGYAFQRCTYLKSMTIGNSVTSIGDYAFFNCNSLTSVTIPDSVTSIGDYAFHYCPALTSVTIPNSLTDIGKEVFSCCSNLTNVTLQKGLTYIGESMFEDCRSLTSVTIPESVYCIARKAFFGCENLTSVTIPGNANIGDRAFETYPGVLTSLTVCGSVTSSGLSTFRTCRSLNSVIIQDGVTSIGDSAFSYFDTLTSITIPNSVLSIGDSAFSGCSDLSSLTIPDSVTSIGNKAFSGCTSLTSMKIPRSVTEIGSSAFSGCSSLTNVTIPISVASIGSSAFSNCTSLTNVTIPAGVTSIGESTFSGCTGLKSVVISAGVTSIGYSAFSGCTNLTSIEIPDSITTIGNCAFSGCSSLPSITIPDSVTRIGSGAFSDCSSLTSITIPDSVTSIGGLAFSGCSSLTSIYFTGNAPSIDSSAFTGITATVYYPVDDPTWTEEVSQNNWGTITWKSWIPGQSDHYDPDDVEISYDIVQAFTDHMEGRQIINKTFKWAFANWSSEFPQSNNGYYISRNDFLKLYRGLSNTDRFKILGSIMPDTSRNPLRDEDCWTTDLNVDGLGTPGNNTEAWGGSCAGMSTLAMLINSGIFSASNIDSKAESVSEIKADSNAASAINFYHCQQNGTYQNRINDEFYQLGVSGGQKAQLAVCERLGQKANDEGTVFELTYQWFGRNDDGWENNSSGHTVLGYGLERNIERTYEGITYTKRILIYDVANPYNDLETTDLYFNDEGQFCVPGQNLFSSTIDMDRNENDNGKLILATDDARALNTVNYATGANQSQALDLTLDYMITRLEDTTNLIIEDIHTGEIWRILRSGSTSDNSNRRLTVFGRNNIHKVSASCDEYTIVLPDPTHEYRISSENTGIDCMVSRGDYLAAVKTDSPGELIVGNRGEVDVKTNSKGEFSVTMVSDEVFESTEANQITIVGSDASSFKTQSDENGITIKTDNDGSLSVYGCNDDDCFSETIDNSQSEVIIDKDGVTQTNDMPDSGMCGDDLIWELNSEGTLTISGTGDMYDYGLSSNQAPWFKNEITTALKSVIIKNGVTTIGEYAFPGCIGLERVTIPEGVTSIGQGAFDQCTGIGIMEISSSVESIGAMAFSGCTSLEGFTVDSDNAKYSSVNGMLLNKDQTELICCPAGKKGLFFVPDGVVKIASFAFDGCGGLTGVYIPDGVSEIGDYAFSDCIGLMNLTIPSSITNILFSTFNNCSNLSRLYFIGTQEEWDSISISDTIRRRLNAIIVFVDDPKNLSYAEIVEIPNQTYTGKTISPDFEVHQLFTVLERGKDYKVSYFDNVNAGTASVIITGIGDYTGTITKTFTIEKAAQSITADDLSLTLPGTGIIFVSGNQGNLTFASDNTDIAEVDASGNVTAKGVGTANITITAEATDNYMEATKTITVTVAGSAYYAVTMDANGGVIINETDDDTGRKVTNAKTVTKYIAEDRYAFIPSRHVQNEDESLFLTGWALSPDGDLVTGFNESFKPDSDCTLYAVWKHGKPAGTLRYGDLNYNGILDGGDGIKIQRHNKAYNDTSVRAKHPDWIMAGYEYEAADINHDAVINGADYMLLIRDIAARNNEETQAGHPDWIISETFTTYSFDEIEPISIEEASITGITSKAYTGNAITQELVVKIGDTILEKDIDYTIAYSNNINVGTATVTITGKGNYKGTASVDFKINKAAQSITAKAVTSPIAVGKATIVSVTGAKGTKSFKSSDTTIATVDSKTGKVTARKVGTVKITATSAATANYNAASKTVTIKVVPAAVSSYTAANLATGIKLTWKKVTGANGYKVYRGKTLIKTVKNGAALTCTDTKANSNGAKYTFMIVPKSAYGDGAAKIITIYRVAGIVTFSVKNNASKRMTVRWNRNARASGYQILYSRNKSFSSGNKAVNVTNAATVSKVIGSLTKGRTYYVKIRSFKKVGGTRYWSVWSSARSVKISK